MKKQLGIILLIFIAAVGFSGAATAVSGEGPHIVKVVTVHYPSILYHMVHILKNQYPPPNYTVTGHKIGPRTWHIVVKEYLLM